jgi:protein-tyrosine phosphatase
MKPSLYWVAGPWPGRLAIMPRPRGGDWLEDEADAWRQEGVQAVVSLLTCDEVTDLDLGQEAACCRDRGIDFISFPVVDRDVPPSRKSTWELVQELGKMLAEGKTVAVHCRQGIGRAALVAASLLIAAGPAPESAIERLTTARGCPVPETAAQREWVTAFVRDHVP